MPRIGLTTTVPVKIILAANHIPVDLIYRQYGESELIGRLWKAIHR